MSAPITINVNHPSSSLGLYVPIHKRAGSNSSSPSSPSTSLPSSDTPSYIYSRATLFSLQPFADENMKAKMRATCPEVVMTRKMRKGLEFNGKRPEITAPQQFLAQAPSPTPTHTIPTPATARIHTNVTPKPPVQSSNPTRVLPRRSRPAGRAPERRRNAFATSFSARRTGNDSWRIQSVPMSPLLAV